MASHLLEGTAAFRLSRAFRKHMLRMMYNLQTERDEQQPYILENCLDADIYGAHHKRTW